jgi:hypothetical protein
VGSLMIMMMMIIIIIIIIITIEWTRAETVYCVGLNLVSKIILRPVCFRLN